MYYDDLPDDPVERAIFLRSIITSLGTGGAMDDATYRLLRSEFLNNPATKRHVPQFVVTNIDSDGMWQYLKGFHTGGGAYAARREHIAGEFSPLIATLVDSGTPSDALVNETLTRYDGAGVFEVWKKALARRTRDPEGAITAARTLLEEVCKHILDDANEAYDDKSDLPKLYSQASKLLQLAPSQHTEDVFKRILGGCHTVVENLGSLRNKISDAHGSGRRRVKPSELHAALAVNLAGTMATFLIDTWNSRQFP